MRKVIMGFMVAALAASVGFSYTGATNVPTVLDPAFGLNGRVLIDVGGVGTEDEPFTLIQLPNGKYVVPGKAYNNATGEYDFTVIQLNTNGSRDTSFDGDGVALTDFGGHEEAYGIAVQPDGKLVAGGWTQGGPYGDNFALARYNPNGSLDTSFGLRGRVLTDFNGSADQMLALALQPDGKIIAGGSAHNAATGNEFALARYTSDGRLDPSFGTGGRVTTDFLGGQDAIMRIALQPDGKILAVGPVVNTLNGGLDFGIARYNADGSLDGSFAVYGVAGIGVVDFLGGADIPLALTLLSDGRFLVGGFAFNPANGSNDVALARFNADGSLDTTFSPSGVKPGQVTVDFFGLYDQVLAIAVQPDGKIVTAGHAQHPTRSFDFAIMRFLPTGALDPTFGINGLLTTDFFGGPDGLHGMVLQSDGKIVVAGDALNPKTGGDDFAFGRYLMADPDWMIGAVSALPGSSFASTAARASLLGDLAATNTDLQAGNTTGAYARLVGLRSRMNGCGQASDADDWLSTCTAQFQVRTLLEQVIYKTGIVTGGVTVLAAGDIASCPSSGDEATAGLLDSLPGTILLLGDLAYPSGTAEEFQNCYDPSWGRHKSRTMPAPGNHEYITPGASGYFGYFGAAAGDPAKGYYSFDVGTWHVVSLNSNCAQVGCGVGSAQYQWLAADLVQHPASCTLAYYHHPTLTAGPHLNETAMMDIWRLLYDNRVDVVLVGHDHSYQRFGALNRESNGFATQGGIRQFLVGTGGQGWTNIDRARAAVTPGLEAWADSAPNRDGKVAGFGVLKLDLRPDTYSWQLMTVSGTFTDSGQGSCWK